MTKREIKRKYWYPISVSIELYLRKIRIKIDRLYKKVWPLIFALWVLIIMIWATLQFKHDYDLIHNYANLDVLNEGIYSNWRTDGNPGQDPPK